MSNELQDCKSQGNEFLHLGFKNYADKKPANAAHRNCQAIICGMIIDTVLEYSCGSLKNYSQVSVDARHDRVVPRNLTERRLLFKSSRLRKRIPDTRRHPARETIGAGELAPPTASWYPLVNNAIM